MENIPIYKCECERKSKFLMDNEIELFTRKGRGGKV